MAYSGRYVVANPGKYRGDLGAVHYRSAWELGAFKWCDNNEGVAEWNSEEVVVPYICKTDGRQHRYFVDLWIKFASGGVLLIEIKPKCQTQPSTRTRKTQKYLKESLTYAKNVSKWEAASTYAFERGWTFQVWTEDTLSRLGIPTNKQQWKKLNNGR